MKLKKPIPRYIVIIIIIATVGIGIKLIGPGVKGAKYIIAEATEIKPSEDSQTPSDVISKSDGKTTNGTDQLIINALLKVKDSTEMARGTKGTYKTVMSQNGSFSDYQFVIKDNLFRKLGTEDIVATPVVQEKPIRQEPEVRRIQPGELMLTGIVNIGDNLTALVEDVPMKKAYFLGTGDKIKNYTVEEINRQSVILVSGESKIICALGKKVYYSKDDGSLISNTNFNISSQQIAQATQTNTTNIVSAEKIPPSPNENSSNLSLIEQMKARRRKELEQQ